jgi:hypothetical protein
VSQLPPIIAHGTPMWQRRLIVAGLICVTPLMMLLLGAMWIITVLSELSEPPPPPQARPVQETKTERV